MACREVSATAERSLPQGASRSLACLASRSETGPGSFPGARTGATRDARTRGDGYALCTSYATSPPRGRTPRSRSPPASHDSRPQGITTTGRARHEIPCSSVDGQENTRATPPRKRTSGERERYFDASGASLSRPFLGPAWAPSAFRCNDAQEISNGPPGAFLSLEVKLLPVLLGRESEPMGEHPRGRHRGGDHRGARPRATRSR